VNPKRVIIPSEAPVELMVVPSPIQRYFLACSNIGEPSILVSWGRITKGFFILTIYMRASTLEVLEKPLKFHERTFIEKEWRRSIN
jgi:hypothetical protein